MLKKRMLDGLKEVHHILESHRRELFGLAGKAPPDICKRMVSALHRHRVDVALGLSEFYERHFSHVDTLDTVPKGGRSLSQKVGRAGNGRSQKGVASDGGPPTLTGGKVRPGRRSKKTTG